MTPFCCGFSFAVSGMMIPPTSMFPFIDSLHDDPVVERSTLVISWLSLADNTHLLNALRWGERPLIQPEPGGFAGKVAVVDC